MPVAIPLPSSSRRRSLGCRPHLTHPIRLTRQTHPRWSRRNRRWRHHRHRPHGRVRLRLLLRLRLQFRRPPAARPSWRFAVSYVASSSPTGCPGPPRRHPRRVLLLTRHHLATVLSGPRLSRVKESGCPHAQLLPCNAGLQFAAFRREDVSHRSGYLAFAIVRPLGEESTMGRRKVSRTYPPHVAQLVEYMGSMGYSPATIRQRAHIATQLPTVPEASDVLHLSGPPCRTPQSKRAYLSAVRCIWSDFRFLGLAEHDPTAGIGLRPGRGHRRRDR